MEQDPKRKRKGQKQGKKEFLSEYEAKEYELLHREEMDQWKVLREILRYALLIIDNPDRLPEWGYIRLFRDIYTEYEGLNWNELDDAKINLLEKDIHQFNLARTRIDANHRDFLLMQGIILYKLRFCPPRE